MTSFAETATASTGGRPPQNREDSTRRPAHLDGHANRIGGLDGLRALAVLAVVVFHLGRGWLSGGFLGVDLFFVISGFLITTLLLAEADRSGRIDLRAFYKRRLRRLAPALILMLLATLGLAATVARDSAIQLLRDLPGAILYASNWWAIAQDQSYFELVGRGNLLAHLWSLAVEEQFYLLWPLAVIGMISLARRRNARPRRIILIGALLLATASTAWMTMLAVSLDMPASADPSRIYFGTDTHAMSVLTGCALAALWQPLRIRRTIPGSARRVVDGFGAAALLATGVVFVFTAESQPWLYRGGFLVVACLFALLIASVTHPASRVGRALDARPARWVGERSYGIYLWHWPIFLVTRPGIDIPWSGLWVEALRIAAVLVVAAASYRYVEVPIRRDGLAAFGLSRTLDVRHPRSALPRTRRQRAWLALGAIASAAAVASLVTAPSPEETLERLGSTESVTDAASPVQPATVERQLSAADVSLFGDSVALFAVDSLRRSMPGLAIDAGINRAPEFIQSRVLKALDAGTLRRAVVLHIGNAGPVSEGVLDATLARLSDRERVVVVNAKARFPYVPEGNKAIARAVAKHPNAEVADWAAYAEGHPEWFVDALHLTDEAKPIFAEFIRSAVLGTLAPDRFAQMRVS